MADFAIVTTCGERILPEFMLLLKSIRLFMGDVPVIVAGSITDHGVLRALAKEPNVETFLLSTNYDLMKVGYDKAAVMRYGLERHTCVLYCDSDVFFVGPFMGDYWQKPEELLMLSSHHIKPENAAAVGEFNAGYIACGRKSGFPDWFEKAHDNDTRTFREQLCLSNAPKTTVFSEQHNIGWWRLRIMPDGGRFDLHAEGDKIFYNGYNAVSIHTHILRMPYCAPNTPFGLNFNNIVYKALACSKNELHQELFSMLKDRSYL